MLVLQLKRIGAAFDRIYRMEQNSNLEKIEQANSTLESKMDALLSGKIDDVALQTDIEQKLNDLETQYAPKLTEVTEQLEDTEKRTSGFINVREFGVKENDGIDYTNELQNAIDYACTHGVKLQFNAGEVKFSEPGLLIWRAIICEGSRGTIYANNPTRLTYNGSGSAITFRRKNSADGSFVDDTEGQVPSPYFKRIGLQRDFSADTSSSEGYGNQGYGYDFYRTSEGRFEECAINGFKVGIHGQGLSISEFVKCDIKHNSYGVWLATGAENGSRSYPNPKVAFKDCNFYINKEAHVVPGYFQNTYDNCHMEISKRTFYFPMNSTNRLIDTLTITKLNNNLNVSADEFYSGGFPDLPYSSFIDVSISDSSVVQINNLIVEHSRIWSKRDNDDIIKTRFNGNALSQINMEWHNNYHMGIPMGLINSDNPNFPFVVLSGKNTYRDKNNSNIAYSPSIYGTGGKISGVEYQNNQMTMLNPVNLPFRTYAASPIGNVLPLFSGEELFDTQNNMWYKAYGLTNTTWSPMTMNYRYSSISPIGATTPRFLGEEYLNQSSKKWYKAVGLTNVDWVELN